MVKGKIGRDSLFCYSLARDSKWESFTFKGNHKGLPLQTIVLCCGQSFMVAHFEPIPFNDPSAIKLPINKLALNLNGDYYE